MKYLVVKQMDFDRNLETNTGATTMPKNIAQSVTGHFLSQTKKTRRFRSAFTTEQIKCLEREFKKFPYIGSGNRKEVSTLLNIPERAVKIWFQNRRMKEKKEVTNKESAEEEQTKINIRHGQTNIKPFNYHSQSSSTQSYTSLQSKPTSRQYKPTPSQIKLRTIYPDPSITKASIKHFSDKNNVCASNESSNSIQNKQSIKVKNLNNRNFTETNSRIVNNETPVVSPYFNNKAYVPMKLVQNKNICINKALPPDNLEVDHGKVKQENPQDLTSDALSSPQFAHPKFYQINPNQEPRYMPFHVPALPQPPPFVPGNILWKPVNMMPVLPGIAAPPQHIGHNNSFSVMHHNLPKEDCKCNCNAYTSQNMSPLMQIDGRLHLPSQYVLAMPFNHNFDRI